ncbi:MAG: hypothetical protein QOE65_2612 [Solirubrobacteraceae bacterium]|jgi:hypothetical protein|nr:hypothetical protein [Solirubrobacteraceae bacterium]
MTSDELDKLVRTTRERNRRAIEKGERKQADLKRAIRRSEQVLLRGEEMLRRARHKS